MAPKKENVNKENSKLFSDMIIKAEKESSKLNADTNKGLSDIKKSKFWKPIIKKIYDDEKISDERFSKLLNYISDREFEKVEKYIKKKYPEYLEDSDSSSSSSSEDEKPKKKVTRKKGDGLPRHIKEYLDQF